ncbi:hypothetical protein GCM10007301_54160 [Azorhizobium oxalatiphilum]|uniref:Uncharacterized protein n=1 Tax=Azorhizobium oxalatiphilum TaxID=980631 RepID=A0A917CJ60_9HYPH|nr:hypothetical protein [Azorhizobium oxalatiphilum]GGF87440.1 hypothetical protein GCM10007301_54160 [Azorhizobium oxalatiphilum]
MQVEAQNAPAERPAAAGGTSAWRLHALTGGLVAVVVLLLGGAGLLWARHGTAIFFDTVAAGIATCF